MLSPREALITLNLIPGLGSVRIQSLLECFGSAELVLAAPAAMLAQVPRIGPALAAAIADWRNCTDAGAELLAAEALEARLVVLTDDDYPAALRCMSDPPMVLTVRGELTPRDGERGVALVGTRQATPYGLVQARRFGRELADAGCTIISGLARGIDYAAHSGALDAGGRTIAVLGFGLGQLGRSENAALAEVIAAGHGALVSEFPLYRRPDRGTFPQRNRLVAAWARATMVVEAPLHSGAMLTAGLAAERYGRPVFALPGAAESRCSAGCHALIRDGAVLCSAPRELLDDLGWSGVPQQGNLFAEEGSAARPFAGVPRLAPLQPGSQEALLLRALEAGNDTVDRLCTALGLAASELTPLLLKLQIQHRVQPLPGARFRAL